MPVVMRPGDPCELSERGYVGLQDIKFNVHAHPTLSEVLDELFKAAHVEDQGTREGLLSLFTPA